MREAVESIRPIASAASVELGFAHPSGLPAVLADRGRIVQVLSNLIGNAIKFTPRGGQVRVDAQCSDDGVRFSVADTGAGISASDAAHLFKPFWQARRADRRGAGLGLAIAKDLVELHGGQIWFESTPGVGSTFFFTVPSAPSAITPEDRAQPERGAEERSPSPH
jgi:signal transduction histidine kinase